MGEEARRDRLEEDQRGAGDHQDVEDVPGRGRVLGGVDEQRAGVEQGLLADHDQEHRRGEAAAVGQGELRPPSDPACGGAARVCRIARPAKASGTTVRLRIGAAMTPRATAVWPLVIPRATARANDIRAVDSIREQRSVEARSADCRPGSRGAKKLAAKARTAATRIQ